ncbi:hypothetical protein BH10ACT11_BH10ACT11_11530 [soil metagenome]
MRLSEKTVVNAPAQQVWDYLSNPDNYLHFMSGVTRWEVEGEKRSGLGSRRRMLIKVGSAELGGLIEMVEWTEPRDLAWTSISGVDQRGRLRLREIDAGRTRVEFRYAYGVAGGGPIGWLAEMVSKPTLSSHLRTSLNQLKRQVEHEKLRSDAARRKSERAPLASR